MMKTLFRSGVSRRKSTQFCRGFAKRKLLMSESYNVLPGFNFFLPSQDNRETEALGIFQWFGRPDFIIMKTSKIIVKLTIQIRIQFIALTKSLSINLNNNLHVAHASILRVYAFIQGSKLSLNQLIRFEYQIFIKIFAPRTTIVHTRHSSM